MLSFCQILSWSLYIMSIKCIKIFSDRILAWQIILSVAQVYKRLGNIPYLAKLSLQTHTNSSHNAKRTPYSNLLFAFNTKSKTFLTLKAIPFFLYSGAVFETFSAKFAMPPIVTKLNALLRLQAFRHWLIKDLKMMKTFSWKNIPSRADTAFQRS